ncbi:MAG: hypothetical protein ACRENC_17440 [Gemmatimonadaceae bacterium]
MAIAIGRRPAPVDPAIVQLDVIECGLRDIAGALPCVEPRLRDELSAGAARFDARLRHIRNAHDTQAETLRIA